MATADVVILLIGLHGSGKSTFIKAATGADVRINKHSHGVSETTTKCEAYRTVYRNKIFTIIDTPGLADKSNYEENLAILAQIADQLGKMDKACISGVIYMHSIQDMRLTAVHMANFRMLRAICGEQFPHVAFVTSRWDRVRHEDNRRYDRMNHDLELERRRLLPRGPRIFRFLNDDESHEQILDYFADQVDRTTGGVTPPRLQFAEELKRRQFEKKGSKAVRQTGAVKEIERERRKVSKAPTCCIL
ncbi:hypothetical protein QBC34DRAFT_411133 [Podospora aff. communis PSN243]|uniref:G domain-containing protein n=1 Tax=Podospora aff. communis PSN243 TaxID=3040156 RepID=A0AAV9GF12_9PEZI|nr:hypothetical protein QBC34DRAFT_411133 [Podospora aff. communis PSN243]